jgi:hypothetical protein
MEKHFSDPRPGVRIGSKNAHASGTNIITTQSNMDIKSLLVNPTPTGSPIPPPPDPTIQEMPARTVSNAANADAKLPTPPLTTHGPTKPKRKRHDPKPIWAVLEHEYVEEKPRVKVEHPVRQPEVVYQRPMNNGGHISKSSELQGYERPITNDARVYDEISRKICDLIWLNVVEKPEIIQAIEESKGTKLEVEAKWGQIIDRETGQRFQGYHTSECVLNEQYQHKFESTMSLSQHKILNDFLNKQCAASIQPDAHRHAIDYKHLREVDSFYEVDKDVLQFFPPLAREMILGQARQRIRVTREMKTGVLRAKIIKLRVTNMAISSPETEWDYRISINLEIDYPGPVENLTPSIERGKTPESMARRKDRMSYRWLDGAYAIDLTQVITGDVKNHELELEVDGEKLLRAAQLLKAGRQSDDFEHMAAGMMNNLRVLSRELTKPSKNH